MAAAHDELVIPGVLTAVEDLVGRRASGVLEVTGAPSGAIYLDAGQIAFAGASWVPGLARRLAAACPQMAAAPPGSPSGGGADDAAVAALALQRGYLSPGVLHELIGSIVVDAFLVLTVPLTIDAAVTAIRFASTRTYWTEIFPRFPLERVRAEAQRRAERMAEHGLSPTTPVRLRDLQAPAAVLTREQWAVACQIGDSASAVDLAARRGTALSDTVDCLGRLAQAGLCIPVRVPPREAPRPGSGRAESAARPGASRPGMTRPGMTRPGMTRAGVSRAGPGQPVPGGVVSGPGDGRAEAPAAPVTAEAALAVPLPERRPSSNPFTDPPVAVPAHQPLAPDLLRQVLTGLRKL